MIESSARAVRRMPVASLGVPKKPIKFTEQHHHDCEPEEKTNGPGCWVGLKCSMNLSRMHPVTFATVRDQIDGAANIERFGRPGISFCLASADVILGDTCRNSFCVTVAIYS